MNMQEFIDNVSDRIVDYLRDNKTQDMQEVRNIIALHFTDGLSQVFYSEDDEIVKKMTKLIKERDSVYISSRRNAEINAELLKLSQKRKMIRKKAAEIKDASQFVRLIRYLRKNASDLLDSFYETEPKQEPFKKLNIN